MFARGYRYRIYPSAADVDRLIDYAGASRFVFNLAVEQRRDWWRQFKATTGRTISWATQSLELTQLRAEIDWLASVPRCILEQALRDVDRTFQDFFRRGASFPKFRSRDDGLAFRVPARDVSLATLNTKWSALRLPGGAVIKMRRSRDLPTALRNVTVRCEGEKWFASFSCEVDEVVFARPAASVGIDRGVSNTFSLSTGEHFRLPVGLELATAKVKSAQRALSRAVKGSKRRQRQKEEVGRIARRVRGIRNHWLHCRSAEIASRFDVVALERLAIANMTKSAAGTVSDPGTHVRQKAGLNRSILAQGWGVFAHMLEYKVAARGGQLFYVNPAYTSQTCSDCGSVNRESRKSQAVFHCVDCGHHANADTNAAINILRRSPAGVEGAGCGPVEARTGGMLTHLENLAA